MKIVFFTTSMDEGGAQRVISVLSDRFCRDGHDVRILIVNGESKICYELNESVRLIKLDECIKPKSKIAQIFEKIVFKSKYSVFKKKRKAIQEKYYYSRKAWLIKKYFKKEPADIVYSFLVEPNIMIGLVAKKINAKVILAERNYPDKPYYTDSFKKLRNLCYENADVCVFQTEDQKKYFPFKVQKKSVVIFNPIKELLPEPYNGGRKKIIVNYCGFRDQKNLPLLIYAFSRISLKYPDYKLRLFGNGELKNTLQGLINSLGLNNRIELLPFDPNVHSIIIDYSMFVMTSDYEGMPNSLSEAMAIGLPVISTDCKGGGARALIDNGFNGLLVPMGDVDALADAMEDLILHPEKADYLSQNAVKIREMLAVGKISEQWLKLVE